MINEKILSLVIIVEHETSSTDFITAELGKS